MIIQLSDTTSAKISSALMRARHNLGTASGLVFTLMVVTDERHYPRTLDACLEAGREHPSRILIVANGRAHRSMLNAEIRTGEGVPGEVITLRMAGELVDHQASVVLPLLLPDSPVVVWWPYTSPDKPSEDPVGALGTRRITDAAGDPSPLTALRIRAEYHSPGDTDLTWTRLTPWRALLAAALDQYPAEISHATVEAARDNAPAALMAAWLAARLNVEVTRKNTRGPGITAVRLTTLAGDVSVLRHPDGVMADYSVPGQPKRLVALKRRGINELITEELRRMDADDIFEQTTQTLLARARAQDLSDSAARGDDEASDGSASPAPHGGGAASDEPKPAKQRKSAKDKSDAQDGPAEGRDSTAGAKSGGKTRSSTRSSSSDSKGGTAAGGGRRSAQQANAEPIPVTLTRADEFAEEMVDLPGDEAPQLDRAHAPKDQR